MIKVSPLSYSEISRELENLVRELNLAEAQLTYSFERNDFTLKMALDSVNDEILVGTIAIAKRHVENWRIHTFEKGFLSLQALNENIFSTEGLFEQLKLRLSGLYGEKSFEIIKKGNPTQAELSMIVSLVKYLSGQSKKTNPLDELKNVGCGIYLPSDVSDISEMAGYEKIREQIYETIILPQINPGVYDAITTATRTKFENNRPRAVLFTGPPGVGKTSMARMIGKESGMPVVYVPLENIMSAYYGESSKRLALIFDLAATYSDGLILFLDEIDSLAPSRNEKLFEATRRLLSVLLRKIEGLESKNNYLTIGATNRPGDLDHALISRFDTIVEFKLPCENDIVAILGLFARQLNDLNKRILAKKMEGFSPRAIKDICKTSERRHARQMILQSVKEPEAPNFEVYLTALAESNYRDMATSSSGVSLSGLSPGSDSVSRNESSVS